MVLSWIFFNFTGFFLGGGRILYSIIIFLYLKWILGNSSYLLMSWILYIPVPSMNNLSKPECLLCSIFWDKCKTALTLVTNWRQPQLFLEMEDEFNFLSKQKTTLTFQTNRRYPQFLGNLKRNLTFRQLDLNCS